MSSSFGLTFTRNDLIRSVLRALGVIGQTQAPSPEDYTFCSEALNLMLKAWINKGATLWKIREIVVPMVEGIAIYPIGPTGGYLATAAVTITDGGSGGTDGTYALGIADAGGGTGATGTYTIDGGTITAVAITAAGSAYVTPILSFPSGSITGTDITIVPVGLTTPRCQRILDQGNFIRNNSTEYDNPIFMLSRTDYNRMGNKSTGGTIPSQFWYDPTFSTTGAASTSNGNLYVFTVPGAQIDHSMHLMEQQIIFDTVTATELFDFPQEFLNCLKWGLAHEVLPEYGVDDRTEARVEKRYEQSIAEAFAFSVEEASTYFTYDSRGR